MGRLPSTSTTLPAILLAGFLSCAAVTAGKPNILFIMMDDLGFSDTGFSDSRFHTPVLDGLRNGNNAIRFNRSYTTPNCGPSRAAFLSGYYPWRLRLQGNAINSGSSAAIPLDKTLLPQALQTLGYQTHLVGKWHQGFCKEAQTPTKRGFDSFFGFYLTTQDHFSHLGKKEGYDFRTNLDVDKTVQGKYSTHIYSERVREILKDYNDSLTQDPTGAKPFFIMLSHSAVHGPNQVPCPYIDNHCTKINESEKLRRQKCGMMAAVDEGLKNITDDLRTLELMDNLLIVFTSDDGGKTDEGSSNWPLRGAKRTLWEGGIRVNTFLYSEDKNVLPKTDFTYKGLFFISDFYATLHGLVTNSTAKTLAGVKDSYNHWQFLRAGTRNKSNRDFIVYVDQDLEVSMLIKNNMKLLRNQKRDSDWYNPPPGAQKPTSSDRLDKLPKYQLFNLADDPVEANNLKDDPAYEETRLAMEKRLRRYRNKAPEPIREELSSDPKKNGYVWSSGWC